MLLLMLLLILMLLPNWVSIFKCQWSFSFIPVVLSMFLFPPDRTHSGCLIFNMHAPTRQRRTINYIILWSKHKSFPSFYTLFWPCLTTDLCVIWTERRWEEEHNYIFIYILPMKCTKEKHELGQKEIYILRGECAMQSPLYLSWDMHGNKDTHLCST